MSFKTSYRQIKALRQLQKEGYLTNQETQHYLGREVAHHLGRYS